MHSVAPRTCALLFANFLIRLTSGFAGVTLRLHSNHFNESPFSSGGISFWLLELSPPRFGEATPRYRVRRNGVRVEMNDRCLPIAG